MYQKKGNRTCSGGLACGLGPFAGKQSFRLFSNTLMSLRYPSRAKELFAKAEETAKAKYERLKKLVEFYNV